MDARLRLATLDDAPAIARIYAPYVTGTMISFEEEAPSAEVMRERMVAGLPAHPWLVAEGPRGIEAYAYAGPHGARAGYRWSADVTVYAASDCTRRGLGRALYSALFDLLALQGIHRVYGGVGLPNDASEGLHRAMGFRVVGTYARVGFKLGQWWDVRWFERSIAPDSSEPPAEPLPWSRLAHDPRVGAILDRAPHARHSREVAPAPAPRKVALAGAFAGISDHWHPSIAAELNGQHVKLAKFQGAFVWHRHPAEDELFLVVRGRFRMEFRDHQLELSEGEFLVVPRGVEHRPVADEEVQVLLFEPAGTLNTGDARDARARPHPEWL